MAGDRYGSLPGQELDGSQYGLFCLRRRSDMGSLIKARFQCTETPDQWVMHQELCGSMAADSLSGAHQKTKFYATLFVIHLKSLVDCKFYDELPDAPKMKQKVQLKT